MTGKVKSQRRSHVPKYITFLSRNTEYTFFRTDSICIPLQHTLLPPAKELPALLIHEGLPQKAVLPTENAFSNPGKCIRQPHDRFYHPVSEPRGDCKRETNHEAVPLVWSFENSCQWQQQQQQQWRRQQQNDSSLGKKKTALTALFNVSQPASSVNPTTQVNLIMNFFYI